MDALAMLMSGGDINEIVRRLMYGDVEDDGGEEVNLLCVCWYERLWEGCWTPLEQTLQQLSLNAFTANSKSVFTARLFGSSAKARSYSAHAS